MPKTDMSYKEQKRALRYLMFLKKKRDGSIKAFRCADEYMTKDKASSPTVSLDHVQSM